MSVEKTEIRVLIGPTASGKGEIARHIAPRMGAEIVSVDSMKIFRRLDICTAKPPPDARGRVPHHLIDVAEPWESFNVARWLPLCERAIGEIRERGWIPLLVVGTPLYLRSLLSGLFPGPPARWDLRTPWMEEARAEGGEVLHRRLREVDPVAADRLHPNDLHRIIRALEVHAETGRPLSELQEEARGESAYAARMVGVLWPREALHDRIERRVEGMFRRGIVEEVRGLRLSGRPLSRQAARAVGVGEVSDLIDGRLTEAEAIARVQRQTRRLARHQMTWFRKFEGIRWLDAARGDFPEGIASEVEREFARGVRESPGR